METKTQKLKLGIFLFLLFAMPFGAISQTITAYVCGNGQAVLVPDFGTYTPVVGDKIVWSEVGGSAVEQAYNSPNFTTPTGLNDGEHKYTVHVIPADPLACPGDNSDEYVIYKLPSTTITLATVGTTYCTTAPTTAVITSTPTIAPPTGVTLDYTWTATNSVGGANVPITDLGSNAAGVFTFKSGVTPGAYIVTATAKYNTGAVPLRPTTSCELTSTNTQTVTVTAVPGKPTVTVAP